MPNLQTLWIKLIPCHPYRPLSIVNPCCLYRCPTASTSAQPSQTLICRFVGLGHCQFCWKLQKTHSTDEGIKTELWILHPLLCSHRCEQSLLSTYSWQPCMLSLRRAWLRKDWATVLHLSYLCRSRQGKDTRCRSRQNQTNTFLVLPCVRLSCAREALFQGFAKCCLDFSLRVVTLLIEKFGSDVGCHPY